MAAAYPIVLDISGKKILLAGGGQVAARKAQGLLEAGADRLTAVAPRFIPDFPSAVSRLEREFLEEDLDGVELCFAATDNPQVNQQVLHLCRQRRILVNRADRDEESPGDFTLPAVYRSGRLSIAVTAAGAPTLAKAVRQQIVANLDPAWGILVEVATRLRPRVLAVPGLDSARRQAILRSLASLDALAVLKKNGEEGLWAWLTQQYQELGP